MVDLDARDHAHGARRQGGAAQLERGVDLVRPVAGNVDAEVPRDAEVRQAVALGICAEEQDRVGPPGACPCGDVRVVGPEKKDRGGRGEEKPLLLRESRSRGRVETVVSQTCRLLRVKETIRGRCLKGRWK